MKLSFRLEKEEDYRIVEEITREAFWNLYIPGATEHFIIHKLRKSKAFIPELDYVVLDDNKIIGNIVYTHAKIIDKNNIEHKILSFGPVSILPEYQNKGVGKALIEYTKNIAKELGYNGIVIYGYPGFYAKVGFTGAIKYKISRFDGKYAKALLALELYEGALEGISGKFNEDSSFEVTERDIEDFDKTFLPKEKFRTKTQEEFEIYSNLLEEDI